MHRRDFLKTAAQAAVAGAAASVSAGPAPAAVSDASARRTSSMLASYTADDHRRRLENIALCHRSIRTCMRKHLVTDYLPAQCAYNLGEYPCRKPWNPDEYDEQELDRLRDHGIQLLQVFDEWNDSLRLFGGDKYSPLNPAGFQRFVEMVHQRRMKLLPYASPCFLQRTDRDFRQEWSREGDYLEVGYWNMARCSPASPGWRAFLLPRIARILDEYGADGIYLDGGYVTNARKRIAAPAKDEVVAFEETPQHDGAFADLLALIYSEVKRRGGVVKLHVDGADQPMAGDQKVCDYLWVGEGVGNADALREAVKNHPPYVVPCLDMTFAKVESDEEQYLHTLPYLQFPILQAGRPFTGERGMIPGVRYPRGERDFWVERCRRIWEHYQKHPQGPYTYGGWDSVPGRAETRPAHARWLKRYLPLVEEGSWAWLEIGQSDLFAGPLAKGVVASAFAGRELYLVLANYGRSPAEVGTSDAYVPAETPAVSPRKHWNLAPRSLQILCRAEPVPAPVREG